MSLFKNDSTPPEDYRSSDSSIIKLPIAGIAVLVGIIAACSVVVVLAMSGGGSNDNQAARSAAGPDEAPTLTPTANLAAGATPTVVVGSPTPEPPPPTPEAPTPIAVQSLTSVGSGDKLVISRFGISAPLSYKTVGGDGQMPDPEGEDDVAYYNFNAWPGMGGAPGKGGNAVFAGHVDSGRKACKYGTVPPPCAAVLWDLNKIGAGDAVSVTVSGVTYNYTVVSNTSVSDKGDWGSIVSATAKESITIITCGGDFNPATRTYDHRQVVKATRNS